MKLVPDRTEDQDHTCKTFTISVSLSFGCVAVVCVTKGLCISSCISYTLSLSLAANVLR